MYKITINGIDIDGIISNFENARYRAHVYFCELIKNGYIKTVVGIVHGDEISIDEIQYN